MTGVLHGGAGGVTIRQARRDDTDAMLEVARLAYDRFVPRIGREPAPMTCDYTAIITSGHGWVADEAGRIEGILVLVPFEDHLLLENIAVIQSGRAAELEPSRSRPPKTRPARRSAGDPAVHE